MNDVLYQDTEVILALAEVPATQGHIVVYPKEQVNSFTDLHSDSYLHLVTASNLASSALFELMGAHGTNVLIHTINNTMQVDVIARKDGDGLNFLWTPKQGNPSELSAVGKKIKDAVDYEIWARDNPEAAKKGTAPASPDKIMLTSSNNEKPSQVDNDTTTTSSIEPKTENTDTNTETNYLLRSLRRTP